MRVVVKMWNILRSILLLEAYRGNWTDHPMPFEQESQMAYPSRACPFYQS